MFPNLGLDFPGISQALAAEVEAGPGLEPSLAVAGRRWWHSLACRVANFLLLASSLGVLSTPGEVDESIFQDLASVMNALPAPKKYDRAS